MPLQDQVISIAMGNGLDTKTDKKAVVTGHALLLENAVFTTGNDILKRNGYDTITNKTYSSYTASSGTLVAPKFVKSFNNELVCADSNRLWAYSPSLGTWIDKGPYESIASQQMEVSPGSANGGELYQSCALLGNYMLVTWQQGAGTNNAAAICVIDITTGSKILPDTLLGSGAGTRRTRCCVLGGTTLAAFYCDASNNIIPVIITIASNTVTYAEGTAIFSATGATSIYDVAGTSTGGVVVVSGNAKNISSAGVVTHSATGFTRTLNNTVTVGSDGKIWVYGGKTDAGVNNILIGYIIYQADVSLTPVLAETAIATVPGATGTARLIGIGAVADSTTQQTVVYQTDFSTSNTAPPVDPIITKTVATNGSVGSHNFATSNAGIFSKPFYIGTTRYVFVLWIDASFGQTYPVQPQIMLMNMDASTSLSTTDKGAVVAKALVGTAIGDLAGGLGYLSNTIAFSSTKVGLAAAYLSDTIIEGASTTNIFSTAIVTMDWNYQDAYQALQFNNQLILNGGILSMYDGNTCSELGFTLGPVIQGATFINTAGNLSTTNNYDYYVVFQWTDNQGNLHQSAPSPVVRATDVLSAGSYQIQIDVSSPAFSTKDVLNNKTIDAAVYRLAQTGSNAYQIGHVAVSTSPSSVSAVTIIDNVSEANLVKGVPLYSNGNVLPNDPPPPAMLLNSHNNRVWAVDSTHDTTVWYGKTAQLTVGASFSGDLTVTVDAKGGSISGIVELDDKEIIFKKDARIIALFGDGANDTGANTTLSQPLFIQTDAGCQYSKSIISQPSGVIFRSPKGWYQLDRSTQVSYIGFAVEGYNSQDVTSAVRVKGQTQIRFLTSSGSTLVFDYFYNQWGTFTNHTGYAADLYQGVYTYVRTDGAVYTENTTGTYLDNGTAFKVRAKISYLKVSGIQGFQRVRKALMLGDHISPANGHGVQLSAAYDYSDSYSTPIVYTLPVSASAAAFEYRENLPQQKCGSISILIEEVTTGASGEYIDFTDLSFEAGVKKGPQKFKSSNVVG